MQVSTGRSSGLSHLAKNPANYQPLSPLSFLERTAQVYPYKTAVIYGDQRWTYREFDARCRRLASALAARGIVAGDTVSVLSPNVPMLLETHYAVPMLGAILNCINVRLDAASIGFILQHGESKLLIADTESADIVRNALQWSETSACVIDYADPHGSGDVRAGEVEYEGLLAEGDPEFAWSLPEDEWKSICLNYTSGTTGNPKGALYHHRGAYLNALGNLISFGLGSDSVYLWTLPMFHCNGWTHTWAVTAAGGTHVCLRRPEPAAIFQQIYDHRVTHLCGAPIILTMLAHAPEKQKIAFDHTVDIATGGAAPPTEIIRRMEALGFRVTHLYGLTETYGPSLFCAWQADWDQFDLEARMAALARQGVPLVTMHEGSVRDSETGVPVPWDGTTIGEVTHRGNTVMKGYLKNPEATEAAFIDGLYHTGDLAVRHPDGYIEVKDRAKDIIISGGENLSSLEIEEVLYKHPKIMEAAVVACPDETWGETPCAFVTPTDSEDLSAEEVREHCRANLARFKVPKRIVFDDLPKTSTGKIQKFVLRERAREAS